jgi:Domain of unknown function (DUF1835)
MTKDAAFKKRVRARMAETGEAYTTARMQLMRYRDGPPAANAAPLLHVTNGDSVGQSLTESGLGGNVLVWRDVLHDGPVPGTVTAEELRSIRARYIADHWGPQYDEVLHDFMERDRTLLQAGSGEYILWFEADLYDQLQLIQVLAMLRKHGVDPKRIHLICIGEHQEIAHFGGLGELKPDQLTNLYPRREQLDEDTLALASAAWTTFGSDNPTPLTQTSRWTSRRLRFLTEAFARLAEEYPWRSDGLSLTQRRILAALAHESLSMQEIFGTLWRKERRPYLGDWSCFAYIRELALAPHPLLRYEGRGPEDPPDAGRVALTETGRRVLAAELDHTTVNGPDRWIGGVHLHPDGPAWRYDERLETLVLQSEDVVHHREVGA